MIFKTVGNKSIQSFFFPCNGGNRGKQHPGCRENGRKILLCYADGQILQGDRDAFESG